MKIIEQIARLRELLAEAKLGDGREEAEAILSEMLADAVRGNDELKASEGER